MFSETFGFLGVLLGSCFGLVLLGAGLSILSDKIKEKKKVKEDVSVVPYKLEPVTEPEHECNCGGACGDNCKCHPVEESDIEAPEYVFINGGASSSNKYHKYPDAHGMDGAERMTKKEAEEAGYEPCSRCFK